MERFKVEDEIELADILEQPIEGLDVHLDQVDQRKRRFGGGRDDDEVESRIMSVGHERGYIVVLLRRRMRGAGSGEQGWEGKKVTRSWGAVRDECEYFRDQPLLYASVLL